MQDGHLLMSCPGCGAPLTLRVDAGDNPGEGFLICDHGHIYELDDPDDDQTLQAAIGADYRRQLVHATS